MKKVDPKKVTWRDLACFLVGWIVGITWMMVWEVFR